MDPATIRRAKEIFAAAVDRPAQEQNRLVSEQCGDDSALHAFVLDLLHQDTAEDDQLLNPSHLIIPKSSSPPQRIGAYRILRVLGEGGMGVVYEARQEQPDRRVALKVIRAGLHSNSLLRRFHHEAEVLGQLHHPGVAHIYEAGTATVPTPGGGTTDVPFVAMELIDGESLTAYARTHRLDAAQSLELFAKVCDAVQHAHVRGVIHRDLKPGNILVDATGQPKILDFGIARVMGRDRQGLSLATEAGQIMGTIAYMSPEQLAGDSAQLDTRSDVYALGAILYELLTGTVPHACTDCSIAEAARRIQFEEPTPVTTLDRRLRGDIATIVSRAIARQRVHRYQSAADLAADIRRYLCGEPIAARRDSTFYVLAKTIKRYRAATLATGVCLLLLTAFAITTSIQGARNRELAIDERVAREAAEAAEARASGEAAKLRRSLYVSRIGFAQAALAAGDVGRVKRLLAECPEDLRNWEWRYVARLVDRSCATFQIKSAGLASAVISDDGTLLLTAFDGSDLAVLDLRTRSLHRAPAPGLKPLCLGLNQARRQAAVDFQQTQVRIVDLQSGQPVCTLTEASSGSSGFPDRAARCLRWSPSGDCVAVGGPHGTAKMLDAGSGALLTTFPGGRAEIICLAFTPDGSRLIAGDADGWIRCWDAATGEVLLAFSAHDLPVHSLAVSPKGNLLASGSNDQTIRLWNLASGARLHTIEGHEHSVSAMRFNSDGTLLASASYDHTLRLWNTSTGEVVHVFRGHGDKLRDAAFLQDGGLVSVSGDGEVKWWPAAPDPDVAVIEMPPGDHPIGIAFSSDGSRVLATGRDGTVTVWDCSTLQVKTSIEGHEEEVMRAAFSPDDRRIASAGLDGTVRLWDADSGLPLWVYPGHDAPVRSVAFSPDGSRLVSADMNGRLILLDAATGGTLLALRGHSGDARYARFSPDGRLIASCGSDRLVRLWNAGTGEEVRQLAGSRMTIDYVTFSPDGTQIAAAGGDGTLRVWNVHSGELVLAAASHSGAILSVDYSPDGSRIVTSGDDCVIRLWDATTGEEIFALRGHERLVISAAFSPDGRCIASTSDDGTVRIWTAAPTGKR